MLSIDETDYMNLYHFFVYPATCVLFCESSVICAEGVSCPLQRLRVQIMDIISNVLLFSFAFVIIIVIHILQIRKLFGVAIFDDTPSNIRLQPKRILKRAVFLSLVSSSTRIDG